VLGQSLHFLSNFVVTDTALLLINRAHLYVERSMCTARIVRFITVRSIWNNAFGFAAVA
jgi:hypothetical protein